MLQSKRLQNRSKRKKEVIFDPRCKSDFEEVSPASKKGLASLILALGIEGLLSFPNAKKLDSELFEIRLLHPENWRIIYSYVSKNRILLLNCFLKKSNKTPIKEVKLARKRLNIYRLGNEKI